MGLSLNPRVVVPIHFLCAIGGDPYTCGWDDSARGHRSRTRSQRLNLDLAVARLPGKLTATVATGVPFRVVRCAAWQSARRGDHRGDAAADHDLIRAGWCFRRESLAGQHSRTPQEKPRQLSLSQRWSRRRAAVPRIHRQRSSNLTMTTQPQGLYGYPHLDPGNVAHPMF